MTQFRATFFYVLVIGLGFSCAAHAQFENLKKPIVVPVPAESEYTTHRNLVYSNADSERNRADIFLPSDTGTTHPAVIFVHGGPVPPTIPLAPKDWGIFQSYGKLAAANALSGVVFNHRLDSTTHFQTAADDVKALVDFVRSNAGEYGIDKDRVCLWFFSGGGSQVAPFLAERPEWLKCIAIYYAVVDPAAWQAMGISLPKALDPFGPLQEKTEWDPAFFVAEAGKDSAPINEGLQRFVKTANENGWKLEYWNHPNGEHSFDARNDDARSRAIILRTMDFLNEHLSAP